MYAHVVNETPKQTPGKWAYKQQGRLVIARNPNPVVKSADLPAELQETIRSHLRWEREGAVRELARMLGSADKRVAVAARAALELMTNDDSRQVSTFAAECLAIYAEAQRVSEETEAKRLVAKEAEAERAEADRIAAEKAEAERIAAEKAEAERKAAEAERVASDEKRAEADRLTAERVEAERIAAEAERAEAERIDAEKTEAERIVAEKAEVERIAAEKAEAERLAAEKADAERKATEKAAAERMAQEKVESERIASEKVKAERMAAEKTVAARQPVEQSHSEIKPSSLILGGGALVVGGVLVLGLLVWAGVAYFNRSETATEAPTDTLVLPIATLVPTPNLPESTTTPSKLTESTEAPTNLLEVITSADGSEMVLISAGPFEMGSADGDDDESPMHTVTLDDYYIDDTEVTNAQYNQCVDAGACDSPADTSSYTRDSYYYASEFNSYPVIWVSWKDANTFCEWRGDRLPTEAEWEKAARGDDGRVYPWGDTFDGGLLNYCDVNCGFDGADQDSNDGHSDTAPVGNYPRGSGPNGVLDMAGNVWEWVADWYDEGYYASSPSENPSGPTSARLCTFQVA